MTASGIAILYHSACGNTALQARAVFKGAEAVRGVTPYLFAVDGADAPWRNLLGMEALIFGAPTHFSGAPASFKAFQDASWERVITPGYLWGDKLAAGFTNSAYACGDKLGTLLQLALFAAQHGMLWVSLGLAPHGKSADGTSRDLNRLGSFLGATAQSPLGEWQDRAPFESDLATAEHLGRRVAEAVLRQVRRSRRGSSRKSTAR